MGFSNHFPFWAQAEKKEEKLEPQRFGCLDDRELEDLAEGAHVYWKMSTKSADRTKCHSLYCLEVNNAHSLSIAMFLL